MTSRLTVVFALLSMLLLSQPAYAYLDTGTGSMIVQLILGGALSAGVFLRFFTRKLLGVWIKNKDNASSNDSNQQ